MVPRYPLTAFVLCLVAAGLTACIHSPGGRAAGSDIVTNTQTATAPLATDDVTSVPVVISARVVCRLIADNPGAAAAGVRGADGAVSVMSGGVATWFFGDTLRDGPGGRQDVIAASVATSNDVDGSDCVRLAFKTGAGGAVPLFPGGGETTAWPDGVLALDDGAMAFYIVKVQRDSPFAWHVSSVGLGSVAAGSTNGVRRVETIWDEGSGFGERLAGVRSPVRDGDNVIVYIRTESGANYVARAPVSRIGEAAAYEYWDGNIWQSRPQDAIPMWPQAGDAPLVPADNGVSVTFDQRSQLWLAMYNADLARVAVRSSPHPWGPWSAPRTWFDCGKLVEDVYPYCYSAELHRELSQDPSIAYVTFSSQRPYDVTLMELRFAEAIHEWRAGDGALRYAATSPGDGYVDAGVAFYAGGRSADGLVPLSMRSDGTYALDAGADAGPSFWVFPTSDAGPVRTEPVYRWTRDGREALAPGDRPGWTRAAVAFYVPCSCDR